MRFTSFLVKVFVIAIVLSSCVSQQKYDELTAVRDYYKSEAEAIDSTTIANQELSDQNRELELQLKQTLRELEELAVANQSLSRNYDEILDKYNKIVKQNENELTTYSYEKLGLQEQLTAQQTDLEDKEKELARLEYELYQKETTLNNMEYNFDEMQGSISDRDARIKELQEKLDAQETQMENLRTRLSQILRNFSNSDLSVDEKNGKIYVSMSQNLLFRSGSDRIDRKGRDVLNQLSNALNSSPDIEITVEGHTDSDGPTASNWDLSTRRATSVVKNMIEAGVDPTRLTAAGRGEHVPIAPNNSSANKAKNRRTDIILAPRLDDLYSIIENE